MPPTRNNGRGVSAHPPRVGSARMGGVGYDKLVWGVNFFLFFA